MNLQKIHTFAIHLIVLISILVTMPIACAPFSSHIHETPPNTQIQTPISIASTPIPSATTRPTFTAMATPTLDTMTSLALEFNVPTVCLFNYLISNDQNWIAADCPLYRELILSNKLSGEKIAIDYEKTDIGTATYLLMRPLGWSSDYQYFYFTTRCCEYEDDYNSNGSLYQFDVKDGTSAILIHAVYEPFYFLPPDGERLVYFNHHAYPNSNVPEYLEIGMLEFSSAKSKRIVLTGHNVPLQENPNHIWSNNNKMFAIVLEVPNFTEMRTDSVLLRVDFTTMRMTTFEEFNENKLLDE